MKRLVVLIAVASLSVFAANAQTNSSEQKQARREQIVLMRIGYISEKISLTAEQSTEFWSLYNRLEEEFSDILFERRDLKNKIKENKASRSDINRWLDLEAQLIEKKKEYIPEILEIISEDQLAKLFIAEEDFKSELIRTLSN